MLLLYTSIKRIWFIDIEIVKFLYQYIPERVIHMANEYTWNSPRKSNEVIETMLELTDRKTRTEPFSFTHKLRNNGITFRLWYDPIWGGKASYNPPSLKGTIQDTTEGCKISLKAYFIMSYIDNSLVIIVNTMLFAAAIAALYVGFDLAIIPATICFLGAIGCTLWFRFTYKKYHTLIPQLELMDIATNVTYQSISD